MARLARVVVPGIPHHVTQRGVRRMRVFFHDGDYRAYLDTLAGRARRHSLKVWAYCLMPNHVHLLAVPSSPVGLARPIGEAHRRYAVGINRRQGWTGHLWQERLASFPMDEAHLLAATRYVLMNPVRAGLVRQAIDWPHSSARAHLLGRPDPLVDRVGLGVGSEILEPLLQLDAPDAETESLRRHSSTGRPLGSESFVSELEGCLGRRLRRRLPGPRKGG